jgi:hypothetical protein
VFSRELEVSTVSTNKNTECRISEEMTPAPGMKIGSYKIHLPLGAGGMGVLLHARASHTPGARRGDQVSMFFP